MKNFFKIFGIIALAAIIGFSMAACDSSGGGGGDPTPGPVDDRLFDSWSASYNDDIIVYFSSDDIQLSTDGGSNWSYIVGPGGDGDTVAYNATQIIIDGSVKINYSINSAGTVLTISDAPGSFAGYNGTYNKVPDPGTLTITNFRGGAIELTEGNYVAGYGVILSDYSYVYFTRSKPSAGYAIGQSIPASGSITLQVWKENGLGFGDMTNIQPYTGSDTMNILLGDMTTSNYFDGSGIMDYVDSGGPITFTNGNATINFATQMEED